MLHIKEQSLHAITQAYREYGISIVATNTIEEGVEVVEILVISSFQAWLLESGFVS
ncbi:hypothetical protein [Anaplasma phagocytophilum]|uniref:Uncharacterized protein n=2 Tax=Anaplasma phagocytophilum TaxID=948 RepID=A0A0F3PVN7_ANAPH|nr:hypothetical protein [Anaplasma phagocytophilum]EOA62387.1 hypothetical protein CRT38_03942 [Anaplasma phagocytophilum str. CRT38]KJV83986.1 hypothetical protein APHCRT_1090 [Anaplasma phagocytophilum str. CRT53-1]